jgi:PTS system nitrogen regulatory IIA component
MGIEELASYLQRDVREVGKLASRGHLPGRKVGGQWRFALAEINHWIETKLHEYTEAQLSALEAAQHGGDGEPLLANLLSEATIAVPLIASTRGSVLRELVVLAEQSWQVYDPEAIHEAVRQREEMGSTALPSGVAIPHPHRRLPGTLGESVIAFARTARGIPFGARETWGGSGLTDLFFLVLCQDDRTHLRVLARLTRLLMRPDFVTTLRQVETPAEAWETITAAEQELLPA